MTVARDAVLEFLTFTTTSPATLSFTPVGTPRGITVVIAHGAVSTDLITSVTYGGVAMARIGTAVDTAGEAGRVYTYFLGASIPTGTQTVSIVHTGSADVKWACVQSVTAAADTEVVTSAVLQAGNQADPQIALNTVATESLRNSILYSGLPTPTTDLTVLSGMEAISAANTVDFGAFCALFGEQTTAGSGSFTIGYTALTDDVAMSAIAIQEVAGGAAAEDPYPYMGGGYYPVEG